MSRLFKFILVLTWLAFPALLLLPQASPGQEKATKKEVLEKLKGGWECVAEHKDGKLEERSPPYTSRWFFEGEGVFKGRTGADPNEVTQSGIWTIVEVGENSFKMNIDITEGEGKGETYVGIADFSKDRLRWSFRGAKPGGGRPDEFVTKEGDKVRVYTFQRIK